MPWRIAAPYGLLSQQGPYHNSSPAKDKARQGLNFDLQDKVYVITGGGGGLGLVLAEAIAQKSAKVHCLDKLAHPDPKLTGSQREPQDLRGSLHYHDVDVRNCHMLDQTIADIVSRERRVDGLVAAAGVQRAKAAIDYTSQEIAEVFDVNYTGVFLSANAAAQQMIRHQHGGSIVLIASMSGLVANKGLNCAVFQLARNLAMEWGRLGIRVNALCPGHIVTPMLQEHLAEVPRLQQTWEQENMLGRLAAPEESVGAIVFLLSEASSFMTGTNVVIDGGHTAW